VYYSIILNSINAVQCYVYTVISIRPEASHNAIIITNAKPAFHHLIMLIFL